MSSKNAMVGLSAVMRDSDPRKGGVAPWPDLSGLEGKRLTLVVGGVTD